MRTRFRDEALESRFLTEEMGERPLRGDIPIQLPQTLQSDALALRNRLLHFRLTHLGDLQSDSARAVPGLDPRFNQTALALLSLADDASLRDDIATLMRAHQHRLGAARARNMEARVLRAANACFDLANTSSVPLRRIAEQATDIGGTQDDPITPRQVGQVLRSHGFALHKSNGTIVVRRASASHPVGAPSADSSFDAI
jgi:hypothetical protein